MDEISIESNLPVRPDETHERMESDGEICES